MNVRLCMVSTFGILTNFGGKFSLGHPAHPTSPVGVVVWNNHELINQFNSNLVAREPDSK